MARGAGGREGCVKRVEWRERLRRFERSTLSVVEFCRRVTVHQNQSWWWS